MNTTVDSKMYVVQALKAQGASVPERYSEMLERTPTDRVIEDLGPWAFLPSPERSVEYCSAAFGGRVWPFAQAIGQDLMACFLPQASQEPKVVVINPWSSNGADVVKAEFADYGAWLPYAAKISREVMERERAEDDD